MSQCKPPQPPKKVEVSIVRSSAAEYLMFIAASGQGGVAAVYAEENVWITQKMMALLYDVDVRTNHQLPLVNAYLDVAEDMAQRKIPMTMQDWETRLNRFIEATDREVIQDAGKVTAEITKAHAESEFEKYRIVQDRLFESDFDRMVKLIESGNSPDTDEE